MKNNSIIIKSFCYLEQEYARTRRASLSLSSKFDIIIEYLSATATATCSRRTGTDGCGKI